MDAEQDLLLWELENGDVTPSGFLKRFSVDIINDVNFVKSEIRANMSASDPYELDRLLNLLWLSGNYNRYVDLLNELLVCPNHYSHQHIARVLQKLKDPSTIRYVKIALDSNFKYLEYTCSEDSAVAKWFSWILFEIGTEDSIQMLKDYTKSENESIRQEMTDRLSKLSGNLKA